MIESLRETNPGKGCDKKTKNKHTNWSKHQNFSTCIPIGIKILKVNFSTCIPTGIKIRRTGMKEQSWEILGINTPASSAELPHRLAFCGQANQRGEASHTQRQGGDMPWGPWFSSVQSEDDVPLAEDSFHLNLGERHQWSWIGPDLAEIWLELGPFSYGSISRATGQAPYLWPKGDMSRKMIAMFCSEGNAAQPMPKEQGTQHLGAQVRAGLAWFLINN